MGSAAKTLMMSNLKNTVTGFKKLIGRNYNDPQVQEEKKRVTYEIVEGPDGTTGIRVRNIIYIRRAHSVFFLQCIVLVFTPSLPAHPLHVGKNAILPGK